MHCYFTLWDQYFQFCKNTVIMPKYGNVAWILESLVSWLKPYMGIGVAIHA